MASLFNLRQARNIMGALDLNSFEDQDAVLAYVLDRLDDIPGNAATRAEVEVVAAMVEGYWEEFKGEPVAIS